MKVLKNRKTAIIISSALLLMAIALVLAILFLPADNENAPGESPVQSVSPSPTDTQTPTPTLSLGKVTGLNLVADTKGLFIIWDEVKDAEGYKLSITNAESGESVYEWDCEESMYTYTEYRSELCYSVTVTAYRSVYGETVYGEVSDAVLSSGKASAPAPADTPAPTVKPTASPSAVPSASPSVKPAASPSPTPEKDEITYEIKVNKAMNVVTVYKSVNGAGLEPYKAFLCSGGEETPEGNFTIKNKWRWLWMVDDSYGQWVSQITGNYLFHSVPYWGTKDAEQLDVGEYNKLGTTCSHGCIRLRAGDAKWIYDNIPSGTKVVIYSDTSSPGPLGKPYVEPLPEWHTWDPTDPNMKSKCTERGCH